MRPYSVLVRPEGAPQVEFATAQLVSGNFFAALGVGPQAGRILTLEDDRVEGSHPVAVISHAYWKRRFAQDPSVVGRTLVVNNAPLALAGVAPPEFFGVSPGRAVEIWIPTAMQSAIRYNQNVHSVGDLRDRERPWRNQPHISWLQLMARLKPGGTTTQAAAELDALNRQSLERHGDRAEARRADCTRSRRSGTPRAPAAVFRAAVDRVRHGRARPADCLRQRGQPVAGARGGAGERWPCAWPREPREAA